MQGKRRINKIKSLYLIGSLLLLSSILIIFYKNFNRTIEIQNEEQAIEEFYIKEENIQSVIEEAENKKEEIKEEQETINYIAVLRIPKIELKKGLVDKNSKYNNIKHNIMIHKESDNPSKVGGNVVLLAHSGNSNVSYFKNLYKLSLNDLIYLDYNNQTYKYKLINIYDIEKNGKASIRKNTSKSSITLITCRNNTNKQIVLIGELIA